jgi:hypothetical protein
MSTHFWQTEAHLHFPVLGQFSNSLRMYLVAGILCFDDRLFSLCGEVLFCAFFLFIFHFGRNRTLFFDF